MPRTIEIRRHARRQKIYSGVHRGTQRKKQAHRLKNASSFFLCVLARNFYLKMLAWLPQQIKNFCECHPSVNVLNQLMANNWKIPTWLEEEVRERDKRCVYCGVEFTLPQVSRKSAVSWEHIINDARIITRENIALCCCGCNASKSQKQLSVWLQSKYCIERGINCETVATIVKQAIENGQ